jgi:cytosine deaminase
MRMIDRALTYCDWAVAKGLLAIRSHVDTSDPRLLASRRCWRSNARGAVSRPATGGLPAGWRVARRRGGMDKLQRALDMGVDVVGGIPHFERTMADGAASVKLLCEIAAARGKLVDMHCDESDDPLSRHIETLAFETQRLGLHGRVTGSHLTSMHSDGQLLRVQAAALMAEAQVHVVSNPLINITLQGRHDTYPKRRGMTRVPELMAAGPDRGLWPGLRDGPLVFAGQRRHAGSGQHGPARGADDQPGRHAPVLRRHHHQPGQNPATARLRLEKGCHADFVLLQARDPVEALRLRRRGSRCSSAASC